MFWIILFFELGYIFNLIGLTILVYNVQKKRHIEGISFYTQLLFSIACFIKIFYFPYTVLTEYWICWIEYFLNCLLCAILLYMFKKFSRLTMEKEKNYFDYRIVLVVSFVLALVSNYSKEEDFEWS